MIEPVCMGIILPHHRTDLFVPAEAWLREACSHQLLSKRSLVVDKAVTVGVKQCVDRGDLDGTRGIRVLPEHFLSLGEHDTGGMLLSFLPAGDDPRKIRRRQPDDPFGAKYPAAFQKQLPRRDIAYVFENLLQKNCVKAVVFKGQILLDIY